MSAFREKPDLETAKVYIAQDNFFWNSGIFIWSAKSIVSAFRKYQPELTAQFDEWQAQFDTEAEQALIDEHYAECKSISVDYAIMEHADNIHVMPADFGWSDLGTWGSLHELSEKDADGNAKIGTEIRLFDTKNTVVHTTEEKRVLICGLDGYIVAEHGDALLICPLEREQEIKEMNK